MLAGFLRGFAPHFEGGTMKNRIIGMALKWAGKRLDGHKTRLGAAGKIAAGAATMLTGFAGLIGGMFPDAGLPSLDWEAASAMMAAGFYAVSSGFQGVGTAHKLEKEAELIKAIAPHKLDEGHPYDGA
jgi:hypothetical protein